MKDIFSATPLISSHGILQRNEIIRLWGKGPEGEKVKASLWMEEKEAAECEQKAKIYRTTEKAEQRKKLETKISGDSKRIGVSGTWEIELPPMEAGGPYSITLNCGDERLEYRDIYIGDVWLLAGQSNMQLPMERVKYRFPQEYRNGTTEIIRQFTMPIGWNFEEESQEITSGEWICPRGEETARFSAAGYFFAKALSQDQQVPVGLILTAVGGTPVEAWMSRRAWEKCGMPELSLPSREEVIQTQRQDEERIALWHQKAREKDLGGDQEEEAWKPLNLDDWERQREIFCNPGIYWLKKQIVIPEEKVGDPVRLSMGTITDADETFVNGKLAGEITYQYPPREYPVPVLAQRENEIKIRISVFRNPGGFTWGKKRGLKWEDGTFLDISKDFLWCRGASMERMEEQTFFERYPVGMYQGMIAPLHSYPIRGICWYQGESSSEDEKGYARCFRAMVEDWRERWGKTLPVLFVQLPNYDLEDAGNWVAFRNMQQGLLNIPNTAMAVTIDCGEDNDLHPTDKKTVGERLAMAARQLVYQESGDLQCPVFSGGCRGEGKWILSFRHVSHGLFTKDGEEAGGFCWLLPGGEKLTAKGKIEKAQMVFELPQGEDEEKLVLQYAWDNRPHEANLCNSNGLPVSPFRVTMTDFG